MKTRSKLNQLHVGFGYRSREPHAVLPLHLSSEVAESGLAARKRASSWSRSQDLPCSFFRQGRKRTAQPYPATRFPRHDDIVRCRGSCSDTRYIALSLLAYLPQNRMCQIICPYSRTMLSQCRSHLLLSKPPACPSSHHRHPNPPCAQPQASYSSPSSPSSPSSSAPPR